MRRPGWGWEGVEMAREELVPGLNAFRVPDSNLGGRGLRLGSDPGPVLGTVGELSDAPWCPVWGGL